MNHDEKNFRRRFLRRKRLIRPFGVLFAQTQSEIAGAHARTLRALIEGCDSLSASNCWWAEYQVAPFVKALAQEELDLRKHSRMSGPSGRAALKRAACEIAEEAADEP